MSQADWAFPIVKLEKITRLAGQSTLRVRLTFLNSVLSAVPLYTLSIFKVPKYVIKKIDQIRCRLCGKGLV